MQALGAPPPDMRTTSEYQGYGQPTRQQGPQRPGGQARGSRPDRSKLLDYTLKGLGLLGVALVAGFLWFLIRNDPAQTPANHPAQQTGPTGLYAFQPYSTGDTVTNCSVHATAEVQHFLQTNPCVSLHRSLFTATLTNGKKVITSVAVVNMGSAATAAQLRGISDRPSTGHIKDLLEDGTVVPDGPDSLQAAGYFSEVRGTRFVVVMTEFVAKADDDDKAGLSAADPKLRAVSADAAKQGLGGSGR